MSYQRGPLLQLQTNVTFVCENFSNSMQWMERESNDVTKAQNLIESLRDTLNTFVSNHLL